MGPPKACTHRLQQEYKRFYKDAPEGVWACPDPKNILEWHYIIKGAPGTPFERGVYYGKVLFPDLYPNQGPAVRMITPSGRFEPNAGISTHMALSFGV